MTRKPHTDGRPGEDAAVARLLSAEPRPAALGPSAPIGERVAALEVEIRTLERRVNAHGAKLDDHGPRVERLERVVEQVLARLAALDARLGKVEARLLVGGGLIYLCSELLLRWIGSR